MKKSVSSSSVVLCLAGLLVMATSALCQYQTTTSVLDTNGRPLQNGVPYYIQPVGTNSGGRISLINRNLSCPLYVGQQNTILGQGLPMTFTPYAGGNVVGLNRDLRVAFSAVATSLCYQSTQWKVGDRDTRSGRRLIITGSPYGYSDYSIYFRIVQSQQYSPSQLGGNFGYIFQWCPTEVCPTCRFICGNMGPLFDDNNNNNIIGGTMLQALDTNNPLVVQFVRA